jgi:hypothetical protein
MAKAANKIATVEIDKALLAHVVQATDANQLVYLSADEGGALASHNPPLIEVNTAMLDPNDPSKAAVRATQAAKMFLNGASSAHVAATVTIESKYALITDAILPPAKKRGNQSGSGAPTKYPFAEMPIGGSFFSANSEHSKGDAVKALGSTVSSQNNKYSEPTGEMKEVTRAVRDKQTHKAILNADGSKQTETVSLPVKSYSRKFTIRPVKAGEKYGGWTAPSDGALIGRTK